MLDDATRRAAVAARRERQAEHDRLVGPRIEAMRKEGMSWQAVARAFNAEGVPTPSGHGRWQALQVQRIHRRLPPEPTEARAPRLGPWLRRALGLLGRHQAAG